MILAGILLKTGAYGLLRFTIPLFPEAAAEFAPIAMLLGADRRYLRRSAGLCPVRLQTPGGLLQRQPHGFRAAGPVRLEQPAVQGAVMQMVAHGLSTAALFMTAGALQQRLHTRDMSRMGGLWLNAPRMGA